MKKILFLFLFLSLLTATACKSNETNNSAVTDSPILKSKIENGYFDGSGVGYDLSKAKILITLDESAKNNKFTTDYFSNVGVLSVYETYHYNKNDEHYSKLNRRRLLYINLDIDFNNAKEFKSKMVLLSRLSFVYDADYYPAESGD